MRPPFRSLRLALQRMDDGVEPGDEAFGSADGVGLTMGALTVLAVGEVALVHLVVPWPTVRAVLLVAGLWSVLAVLETWAGLRRHPHVVSGRGLLLRAGPAVVAQVPWSSLAAVRRTSLHDPPSVRVVGRRLHLPVHGSTTLLVQLREPVVVRLWFGRTAEVDSIALSADDPHALLAAVSARAPAGRAAGERPAAT